MDKKILKFDLDSKNIKIKNILETKDFIKLEIWAISNIYPNNNNSHFPLHTMEKNVEDGNFYDKPVLGKWNSINGDLEVHNSQIKYDSEYDTVYFDYENGETPMGTIRQSDNVEIRDGKDGLKWIVFTAVLWTKYNYNAVKKLLRSRKKKVSVEVSVTKWHYDENDIEIFDEWTFDGVTILGNLPNTTTPAEAGIPDAHLTILEKIEDAVFNKQVKVVQFECNSLEKENQNLEKEQENFEDKQVINSDNDADLYKEENEKGATKLLTYEQKRSILEEKLNDLAKDVLEAENEEGCCCESYVWVADLTETEVFFSLKGVYYKATYEIQEQENEDENKRIAIIDFEHREKQLRSWKDFSIEEQEEPEEESCKTEEEVCKSVEEDCNGDCEGKEETEESHNDNTDDDKSEDHDNLEEPEEDLDTDEEENKEESSENEDDNCKMCDFKVEINGEEISGEKLFEMYNDLSNKFSEVQEKYSEVSLHLQELENESLAKFAYELAKESDLEEEICREFETKCLNGDYVSEEDVTKDIAFTVFKNNKKAKENTGNVEEFSAKINKQPTEKANKNEKNDAFAGCRKIINN